MMTNSEENENKLRIQNNLEQSERITALNFLLEVEEICGMATTDKLEAEFQLEVAEKTLKAVEMDFEMIGNGIQERIEFLEEKG